MINYDSIEEAMAARHAAHQDRVAAAVGLDHTPRPVPENTARALITATGHTHAGITISGCGDGDDTLVAIGHHDPAAFMAAAHAITETHDDPHALFDSLYGEIYNSDADFADMADWGTEDVWHAHVAVIGHGRYDGGAGTAEAAGCLCTTHTWAMREVPAGTDGAAEVTMYRPGVEERADWRYADVFGPYRGEDGEAGRP